MTDESDVMLCEAEVTISEDRIKRRVATGLEIQEAEILVADLAPMTEVEIIAEFNESGAPKGCAGFKGVSNGFPKLIFIRDPEMLECKEYHEGDAILLFQSGGMDEQVGFKNVFISPNMVARGDFEEGVRKIEERHGAPGAVPRLANGGRAPKK